MVTALVTLEAAKRRLNVYHDDQDDDLTDAVLQATAAVLDYIKKPDTSELSATGVLCCQAATLIMLRYIWDGEDTEGHKYVQGDGYLPQAVTSILHRQRDPALA